MTSSFDEEIPQESIEVRNSWIEVAGILKKDIASKVHCPECKNGFVIAKLESWAEDETRKELTLSCSSCGAVQVLTYRETED